MAGHLVSRPRFFRPWLSWSVCVWLAFAGAIALPLCAGCKPSLAVDLTYTDEGFPEIHVRTHPEATITINGRGVPNNKGVAEKVLERTRDDDGKHARVAACRGERCVDWDAPITKKPIPAKIWPRSHTGEVKVTGMWGEGRGRCTPEGGLEIDVGGEEGVTVGIQGAKTTIGAKREGTITVNVRSQLGGASLGGGGQLPIPTTVGSPHGAVRSGQLALELADLSHCARLVMREVKRGPVLFGEEGPREARPHSLISLDSPVEGAWGPATTIADVDLVALQGETTIARRQNCGRYGPELWNSFNLEYTYEAMHLIVFERRTGKVHAERRFEPPRRPCPAVARGVGPQGAAPHAADSRLVTKPRLAMEWLASLVGATEKRVASTVQLVGTAVNGGVDPSLAYQEVSTHVDAIKTCYERALKSNLDLAGKVEVRLIVTADGTVSGVDLEKDHMGDADVIACIKRLAVEWRLPSPSTGSGYVSCNFEFQRSLDFVTPRQ